MEWAIFFTVFTLWGCQTALGLSHLFKEIRRRSEPQGPFVRHHHNIDAQWESLRRGAVELARQLRPTRVPQEKVNWKEEGF